MNSLYFNNVLCHVGSCLLIYSILEWLHNSRFVVLVEADGFAEQNAIFTKVNTISYNIDSFDKCATRVKEYLPICTIKTAMIIIMIMVMVMTTIMLVSNDNRDKNEGDEEEEGEGEKEQNEEEKEEEEEEGDHDVGDYGEEDGEEV